MVNPRQNTYGFFRNTPLKGVGTWFGRTFGFDPSVSSTQKIGNAIINKPSRTTTTRSAPQGQPQRDTPSDPYQDPGGGGSAGYGSGGGAAGVSPSDPNQVQYFNDQINSLQRLLDSSGRQKDQGIWNINNSYNRNLTGINDSESKAMRDYGIREQDTLASKRGALGQIDTNARTTNDTLSRIFGLAGAGVSSAAQQVAPNAVARQATQQRTGAQNTYGTNLRSIDLAKTDAQAGFKRGREDLDSERRQKESSFLSTILNSQNDINSQLSDAVTQREIAEGGTYGGSQGDRQPYQDRIASNTSALEQLFASYQDPSYNVKPVNVQSPDLSEYTADPITVRLQQQFPGVDPSLLPYYAMLQEKNKRQTGLI